MPINLAGIDIDPEHFPMICWFGNDNPEAVEGLLIELINIYELELALETLEIQLTSYSND